MRKGQRPPDTVEFVDLDSGAVESVATPARRSTWPRPQWWQYAAFLGLATAAGFAWASGHSMLARVTVAMASANVGPNGETNSASGTNYQVTTIDASGREFVHYRGPRNVGVLDFVANSHNFSTILLGVVCALLVAAVALLNRRPRWRLGASVFALLAALGAIGTAVAMLRTIHQIAAAATGTQTPTISYGSAVWTSCTAGAVALLTLIGATVASRMNPHK